MDQDRVKGSARQARGSVKDALGGLTGDGTLQAEGKADKLAGKAQAVAGDLKDAARDALGPDARPDAP
jgi:uncharacterized protein YjbJ (UPF0337 family)